MKPPPGAPPVGVRDVTRVGDRLSFVYLERCTVHRDGNAVTATDERGVIHIPAASIGALLLGPGCRVTHQAMLLMAESGTTSVWTGEHGVRYYAHGRPLASSSRLIEAQARLVSNQSTRLRVARDMYAMRFPGEDVSQLTMQQLRGREGARVRRRYRDESDRTSVPWKRRDYDHSDFDASDVVNQALSSATSCLYGMAHVVIVGLGASPALGFVHVGNARSFVYDIADLYKADSAIPVAFDVAATHEDGDAAGEARRRMRDVIWSTKLLARCARDVQWLLRESDEEWKDDAPNVDWDVIQLWDGSRGRVAGGTNYADDVPW